MKSLFICGTDTAVGKTFVTASLAASLNQIGIKTACFKPLESGCQKTKKNNQITYKRADSLFLKRVSGMSENLDDINPYYFKEALAPGIAAQRQSKKISFLKIKQSLTNLEKKYDLVLVEGAGGLLVPASPQKSNVDLIKCLRLPVLLIAHLGLGTLNHSQLTYNELSRNHIQVMGLILNQTKKTKTIADKTNPSYLKKIGLPLWGVVPYLRYKNKNSLIKNLPENILRKLRTML